MCCKFVEIVVQWNSCKAGYTIHPQQIEPKKFDHLAGAGFHTPDPVAESSVTALDGKLQSGVQPGK